jgi:hypothetical protein
MKTRNALAICMLCIGSMQMLGYAVHSRLLRGIGAASGIAPFPKVFSEAEGFEAFAARFCVGGEREDSRWWSRELEPEWYSQLKGPYNRRNVYGATLAFAPRLPTQLRQTLLDAAFAPGSALRRELRIPEDVRGLQITIIPRDGERDGPWTFRGSDS